MFYNTVQLSALFNVPGGTSTLGFPATVTVPGFDCDVIGDGYHVDARLANHLRPTVVIAQILSCVNTTPVTEKYLTAFSSLLPEPGLPAKACLLRQIRRQRQQRRARHPSQSNVDFTSLLEGRIRGKATKEKRHRALDRNGIGL